MKGRDPSAPFLLLVSAIAELQAVAAAVPPSAVLDRVWPGPVTVLLAARPELDARFRGASGTVAVRVPDDPVLRSLLALIGAPTLSTSVNRHGWPPAADPAAIVHGDTLYLYVGHDEARGREMFTMKEWLCFSTTDMKTWTAHGPVLKPTDFKWAVRDAWASHVIEKDGKFYFYAAVEHDASHPGKAIGVAVSDKPTGPFVDARGSALITNEMTPKGTHSWEDIDPTVFTDDDGTTWIAWGNRQCYIAKLKPNMIEIDGPITEIAPPNRAKIFFRSGSLRISHDSCTYFGTSRSSALRLQAVLASSPKK